MADKLFAADTPLGKAIYEFWHSLEDDRQTRAQLRRADGLTGAALVPGTHRLRHKIKAAAVEQGQEKLNAESGRGRIRIAMIAGMLAQIKRHESLAGKFRQSTAVSMAKRKRVTDSPCVSELRFRRLLLAGELDAFYPMLRRTLALMNHSADIYALAADIWFWGDGVRRQWAYDYYDALAQR